MIYGLNFNSKPIPEGWARKFAKRVKIAWMPRGFYYDLVGVATDRESMIGMLVQANNGHRLLHVEERKAPSGPCFGVYVF